VALTDVQPPGVTDKKRKHQEYDLLFTTSAGKTFTCRTSEEASVEAAELVVGRRLSYEIESNEGKIKTDAGKKVDATIARVASARAAPE